MDFCERIFSHRLIANYDMTYFCDFLYFYFHITVYIFEFHSTDLFLLVALVTFEFFIFFQNWERISTN